MFTLQDGREHLYQWDLDRYIIVNDANICEVHFCNRTSDCSLVVEVKDGLAAIPNILLQDARPIRVYAYCDDKYTLTEQQFTVKSRTKPDDYAYTETEVRTWTELDKKIDGKLDNQIFIGGEGMVLAIDEFSFVVPRYESIFIAEYGVTEYWQLKLAYEQGRALFCLKKEGTLATLFPMTNAGVARFDFRGFTLNQYTIETCTIKRDSGWTLGTRKVASEDALKELEKRIAALEGVS